MTSLTIQIARWLKKEEVWRYVGFVSTIVALLFYGLSSSFNSLFGEWSLLKIFLYSVFSLFICLWSLFAKVWQHSTSLRFRAHSAFLVLSITSVYSYFADKAVKGKPDVYSLISCVAFAIMSLSLSRQTQCGFEVDLFYFFLACLIVLFMKIKLALAIVGVGFSYVLIILRSSLDTTSCENLPEDSVVIDVNNARMMQELMTCIRALQRGNSNVTKMFLERSKKYLDDRSEVAVDHNFLIDVLPSEKINDLHETIKPMMGGALEKTCYEVYCNWRRESLEACLFELQKIVINKKRPRLQLDWYVDKILISTLKVAFRILFPSERPLCDRVFYGFSPVDDFCFTEVCREPMVKMLSFADNYAGRDPCEVGLSNILFIFETFCDLIPEFESLFPESLVKEAMTVRDKLENACWDIFMKMEDKIFCNPFVKVIVRPDAKENPMTCCVMDYLELILEQFRIFADRTGKTSSISDQINRIMKRLEIELVAMSENYKYPALSHLFMMNSWMHMEQKAAMLGLIDLDFLQNSETVVRKYLELYQRSSWNMMLDLLKLEEDELDDAHSIKDDLINKHMEFICSHQSRWLSSEDLLSEQKLLIPIVDNSEFSLFSQNPAVRVQLFKCVSSEKLVGRDESYFLEQ